MAVEIERKFLVRSNAYHAAACSSEHIVQGYLQSAPERTVRVRIKGDTGYLTIKGKGTNGGTSRFEWEQAIPLADAESLLQLCEPGIIDKIRYRVPAGPHTWEVDEFAGENAGLVVAEIELTNVEEAFDKPDWLGDEVTGDNRYYNSALKQHPFSTW